MRYKATFVVGFAAGYTLGARAGRERYEQIRRTMSGLSENPAVQSAAGVLQAQASNLVGAARDKVVEKLPLGGHEDPYGPGPVPVVPTNGSAPGIGAGRTVRFGGYGLGGAVAGDGPAELLSGPTSRPEERTVSSRIPDPADPFEEEGLASPDPDDGKRITGDVQEEIAVPGERPIAVDNFGTTAAEEAAGEPLDHKLDREEPDLLARAETTPADGSPDADQPYPEDRDERVGRIVESDEGARADTEPDAVALEVGTDGGGFSAEERAMHIEPEV
jgi:hypothetical protein